MRNNVTTLRFTRALFIIYLLALCWILLLKLGVRFSYMDHRSINLVPFQAPLMVNGKADMGEIILNVIIFIPMGLYAGILFSRWSFARKTFLFFATSLTFEVLQYSLRIGAFDITDIITNTFGGVSGLLIYEGFARLFSNKGFAEKIVSGVLAIGTIVVIAFLFMLKMNMLPIRYQ